MGGDSVIMSIALKPGTPELLKAASKKSGLSVSNLIRILVEKHLSLVVHDGKTIPVVFQVPAKAEPEVLQAWFDVRVEQLIRKLSV